MEFDQGAVVYFACTFRDVDGALVDPNPVTLTVRAPAGTLTDAGDHASEPRRVPRRGGDSRGRALGGRLALALVRGGRGGR
jgi:hypothetical protein